MSERKKQNRKRLSVVHATRRRLREKYPPSIPGKASDYIMHFKELMREQDTLNVVLFGRVSERTQDYKGNLNGQLEWLRHKMKKHNVTIVAEFREIGPGWWHERGRLQAAAKRALDEGAVLLAESTDRFIRSIYYHSEENPSAQPTMAEYEDLKRATKRVTLATIIHPDTHWKKVRSYQTKRGQQTKGKKGGRRKVNKPGYKKKRRREKLPQVLQLRKKGTSWGDIFKTTGIPRTTAADWVKKYG